VIEALELSGASLYLIEVSNLNDEEKAAANQVEEKIDSLSRLYNAKSCSPEQEEELAILISGQQTYQELLDKGTEVGLDHGCIKLQVP